MGPDSSAHIAQTPIDTAGDAIVASLTAAGVEYLFFTSGSEIGFYQEAIAKARAHGHNAPLKLITMPLEHASLNAAIGYAQVSGKPAATAAHVDVGTLHYGGALHTAWRASAPVIITAGFPPTAAGASVKGARDDGGHLWMQEVNDQHGIVRNYTKWDHKLTAHDDPGLMVSRAAQIALSEPRGPVYMSVPKEVSFLGAKRDDFPALSDLGVPGPTAPNQDAVDELAERLVAAKNPVAIVACSGRDRDSVPALVELCELMGIAVMEASHPSYLCFPFNHPLFQHREVLNDTDLVMVIDADVPWLPGWYEPPKDAYIAAIAHDPIRLRIPTYEFPANLRIAAQPKLAIEAIAKAARALLKPADKDAVKARSKALAAATKTRHTASEKAALAHSETTPIDPLWANYQLGKIITDNTIVFNDTLPRHRVVDYFSCARPGSYYCGPGSSGGWASGGAFGAKLAEPDRDVIGVTGDGFYIFGTPAPAIWAAKHYGAPFMMVVYTNRSYTTGTTAIAGSYGADSYAAKSGFDGGYFDPPIDFAKEAEAAGGYGENVTDPAELEGALNRGLEQIRNGTPAVISIWMKRLEGGD